jgi:hypothetical protein
MTESVLNEGLDARAKQYNVVLVLNVLYLGFGAKTRSIVRAIECTVVFRHVYSLEMNRVRAALTIDACASSKRQACSSWPTLCKRQNV